MKRIEYFIRRCWLFLRLVWRVWDYMPYGIITAEGKRIPPGPIRIDASLAWEISGDIWR